MEYDKELATRLNMLDPDEIKKRQVKKWRDEMTAKLKGAANGT